MPTFEPWSAVAGGLFIGVGAGMFMVLTRRIAGNSGAMRAAMLFEADPILLSFLAGLIAAGLLMARAMPQLFEAPPAASLALFGGGVLIGSGTFLGNGCTSGHGLCGLSRYSARSLVAVPTFMAAAIVAATIRSGVFTIGELAPIAPTPASKSSLALTLAAGLAVALVPALVVGRSPTLDAYAGLWCGVTFGVGLSLGGMVRPSVVFGALSPAHIDFTLWALFVTALVTTFGFYRVAQHRLNIKQARPSLSQPNACAPS